MQLFRLDDQIAFVTGAGSGIGQRIAVGLAEAGADVALFDLPASEAGLADTAGRIRALGRRALTLAGDVTKAEDLAKAVEAVEAQLGELAVAVNCAGIANATAAEDLPEARWQRTIDVNLTGVFLSAQAEARVMLPRGRGSIVNIASMSGSIVNRGLLQAHYNTSKAGVIHLTKSLAMEWGPKVRVNAVEVGLCRTEQTDDHYGGDDRVAKIEATIPLGRMARPDEVGHVAVFLASDLASYVSGATVACHGGGEPPAFLVIQ